MELSRESSDLFRAYSSADADYFVFGLLVIVGAGEVGVRDVA
jgi:hypothetical protein